MTYTGAALAGVALIVARWAFIALGGALTAFYATRVRRQYPATGEYVDIGGARLHVVRRGAGPAVVLLHGADGVLQDFPPRLVEDLAADHAVLAFDRSGHGWSGRRHGVPLDLAAGVADLRAALRVLGVSRAVLVGHSYGTVLALHWALEAPEEVAGIVAVAPAAMPYARSARAGLAMFAIPAFGTLVAHTVLVPIGAVVAWFTRRAAYAPDPPPPGPGGPSRAFALMPSQFLAFCDNARHVYADVSAQAPRYGSIRAPLVIVAGDGDRVTRVERHARPLHDAVPGSTLTVIPNTGHQLMHPHANVVADAVRSITRRDAR